MNDAFRRAIFLDRDGVVTEPIWNPATAEYESALRVEDLRLYPSAIKGLRALQDEQFALFLVSNQPSYAKGKVRLQVLQSIARQVEAALSAADVRLSASYYCYHHPSGVVPAVSHSCCCRKPEPYFLFEAARDYRIDLGRSWMVGDRDTDMQCGRRAGCRTLLVLNPLGSKQATSSADFVVRDLEEAAAVVQPYANDPRGG